THDPSCLRSSARRSQEGRVPAPAVRSGCSEGERRAREQRKEKACRYRQASSLRAHRATIFRAGDRTRTGDGQLGKLAFYQLNYAREFKCSESQRSGLNRRPLDYESSALPLSYAGVLHALARTRTATPFGTTPSRWRVYQFHHQGTATTQSTTVR